MDISRIIGVFEIYKSENEKLLEDFSDILDALEKEMEDKKMMLINLTIDNCVSDADAFSAVSRSIVRIIDKYETVSDIYDIIEERNDRLDAHIRMIQMEIAKMGGCEYGQKNTSAETKGDILPGSELH